MRISSVVALALVVPMVAACTQPNGRPNSGVMQGGGVNKSDVGTLAGAIGGGVIGSNIGGGRGAIAATIAGSLLGAYVGNQIGSSLDNADMAVYNQKSQQALETGQPGQPMPWNGPTGKASGVVTPMNYYQNADGTYCREYTQTITVGGKKQEGHGTACRQPDGTWKIVE